MEKLPDDVLLAQTIVQEVVKAKKQLKLYPPNNPIYVKTVENVFNKFTNFFESNDELTLTVRPTEIICHNEKVYENTGKDDNLALFFFKDGLREIVFSKGFTREEFEDFMKILNTDFENDAVNDDVVTLLWEKNFQHVKYIADENFLFDEEEDMRKRFYENVKDKLYSDEELMKAYYDGIKAVEEKPNLTIQLDDIDLQYISQDVEEEMRPKVDKVVRILFEILQLSKDRGFISEAVDYLNNALLYCIRSGDFGRTESIVRSVQNILQKDTVDEDARGRLRAFFTFLNSRPCVREIGNTIDGEEGVEEDALKIFIRNLDRSTIPFFMQLLGEMKTIKGRRLLMEVLSILGRLDVNTIAKGLQNEKWYVVRNVVLILGKIGDRSVLQHLIAIMSHSEERVRRELVKVMGSLGGPSILPHLKQALNDENTSVRITAAHTLGSLKSEEAKRILLSEMARKAFLSKDFSEKKEFYDVITNWKDREIKDFIRNQLEKKVVWRRARYDELRACAAYAIGLLGDKEAIPLLQKTAESKNKLLQKLSASALKKLNQ